MIRMPKALLVEPFESVVLAFEAKARMNLHKAFVTVIVVLLASLIPLSSLIPVAGAAPTGEITLISPPDNTLTFTTIGTAGEQEVVTVRFTNTAGAAITDVASTIQYITLAAANLNPTRTSILAQASATIHDPSVGGRPALGPLSVTGTQEPAPAYYSPYSTSTAVDIWHWNLGPPSLTLDAYTASIQFAPDLRILRPGEYVEFKITIQCAGQVGDSRIWFFFRATEFEPTSGQVPVTSLSTVDPSSDPATTQRMNLYYQDSALPIRPVGWWPLHISYDPYDSNIDSGTGHSFEQVRSAPLYSWTRISTTTRFAKTNKLVHQTQVSDGTDGPYPSSIHICGTKFNDLNSDGTYDVESEPGIDGVTVTLLGADAQTPASQYWEYSGKFSYPPPENVPPLDVLQTRENGLAGSYCFNLINVQAGTYTFFIRITESSGRLATTPTLIGPITITVSDTTPALAVFSIDHEFGNSMPPAPVGGIVVSVDRLGLLAPWIGLFGLLGAVIGLVAISKKRKN